MADLKTALPQKPTQNINGNECTEVPNVAVIVNSGPTRIHTDFVVVERPKLLHLARERVVKTKRHSESQKTKENVHSRGIKE
jgi:hypothetical protein